MLYPFLASAFPTLAGHGTRVQVEAMSECVQVVIAMYLD